MTTNAKEILSNINAMLWEAKYVSRFGGTTKWYPTDSVCKRLGIINKGNAKSISVIRLRKMRMLLEDIVAVNPCAEAYFYVDKKGVIHCVA